MLSCEQATRLMSERQERPLSFSEKASLKLHTSICTGCREFGRQMDDLRKLLSGQKPENKADSSDQSDK
ncbi:MAG: zf-HC2 domain-containing protein [Thalassolituus sp.]